jgi:hypothetical protein
MSSALISPEQMLLQIGGSARGYNECFASLTA